MELFFLQIYLTPHINWLNWNSRPRKAVHRIDTEI